MPVIVKTKNQKSICLKHNAGSFEGESCPQSDSNCNDSDGNQPIQNLNKFRADEFAKSLKPVLREIADGGAAGPRTITRALTAKGIATFRKGTWDSTTVRRLLDRLGEDFKAELKERAHKHRMKKFENFEL